MADPVIFPFQAEGHGQVVSAMRSMESVAGDLRKAVEAIGKFAEQSADLVARSAARGASAEERAARETERAAQRAAKEKERAAAKVSAAAEREARAAVAAANRAGKEQERAWQRAAKEAERAAQRAANATKRSEQERWREVERTARKIERELEREAAAHERAEERKRRAAQRARDAFLKNPMGAVPGLVGAAGGALMGLGRSAFETGVGLAGGAVRESLETQRIANRVSINARMPGQEAVDATQLRKEFEKTAIATPGQSAADIGRAAQAYVDLTGDLDTARNSLGTFATVASATGASVEDVATAAASLGSKFDVKKVDDARKVFAMLTAQGKGGAMTMKDLAAQFQKLAAAGNAFDIGKGPEAVAKLGGLVQIARSGTRSPQQAGTAVENIFSALTSHQKNLAAAHVKLYDKQGGKRDINEILAETVSRAGGSDPARKSAELTKIFGRQGMRAINPLLASYTEATHGLHGKEAQAAGYDAVMAALKKAAQTATDWSEVERDAAQAQRDDSAKLSAAWEKLKAAAGERLAPVLADLASKLASGHALDLFIKGIGLAATALEALASKLQKLGLIEGGTSEEKSAEASGKAAELKKKLAGMGPYDKLSTEKQAEFRAIAGQYNIQRGIAEDEGRRANIAKAGVAAIEQGGDSATAKAAYEKLGGSRQGMLAGGALNSLLSVATLGISDIFGADFKKNDTVRGLAGENLEQRNVRHAAEGKGMDVDSIFGPSGDQLKNAAKQLEDAATKLAAAAVKPPGSVTGAPIAPGGGH